MFGDNPKRPPEPGDGKELALKKIFKTIQGEGPNAGSPSIFIRLGGCNLACDFCDTDFEDFELVDTSSIVNTASDLANNKEGKRSVFLVVITGGEPFRQQINYLCESLIAEGFNIQIETNGTIYRNIPEEVEIICSPKIVSNKYLSIRPDLLSRVTAFKFLISKYKKEYGFVPELGQTKHSTPVYVQPMDEYDLQKNKENKKYTVEIALDKGYKLSYQIHKDLEIE